MNRFTRILFVALLALSLCATGLFAAEVGENSPTAPAESSGWKFDHKIIIVCPWGEGGGADSTLRALTPLLRERLGQPVEVVNITGAGGINGANFTKQHEADGHTFLLGTQSLFIMDVQGAMPYKFKDEFIPVARLVNSVNVIAASRIAMEQRGYTNFSEMREFVKSHPASVTVGMLTTTGVDGISLRQAIEGLSILEVAYPNGAGMNAALKEGQIDLMMTGTDEIADLIAEGSVTPLLALAERRLQKYPNVESAGELGINSFLGPERGIFAKKGTPQGAIDAMAAGRCEVPRMGVVP